MAKPGPKRVRRPDETDEQFRQRCEDLDQRAIKKKAAHDLRVSGQHQPLIPVAIQRAVAPLEEAVTRLSQHLRDTSQEQAMLLDALRATTAEVRTLVEVLSARQQHYAVSNDPPPLAQAEADAAPVAGLVPTAEPMLTVIGLWRQYVTRTSTPLRAAEMLALHEVFMLLSAESPDPYQRLKRALGRYARDASGVKSAQDFQVRLHRFLNEEE